MAEKKIPTAYVLVSSVDDGETFKREGRIEANSADQAIRHHFGDDAPDAWVAAIPESSLRWRQGKTTSRTVFHQIDGQQQLET